MHVLDLHKPALEALSKPVAEWFAEPGNPVRALLWVGALALSLASWLSPAETLLNQMLPDFISISIAVIVIDELVGYRNKLERKQEIINQMGSLVNASALEAVRLARKSGWLEDGLLIGASLSEAELCKARLEDAVLKKVDLSFAKLKKASLVYANLEDAILTYADLEDALLINTNLK